MSAHEEILKYAGERPKTVIVILLGIIAVGSIGGGIWIKNLQSGLEARDKYFSDRLVWIEEKWGRDSRILRQQNSVLRTEVKHLRAGIKDIENAMAGITSLHTRLQATGGLGVLALQDRSSLEESMARIEKQRKELERAIDVANAVTEATSELVDMPDLQEAAEGHGRTSTLWTALAIFVIAALGGLSLIVKRHLSHRRVSADRRSSDVERIPTNV